MRKGESCSLSRRVGHSSVLGVRQWYIDGTWYIPINVSSSVLCSTFKMYCNMPTVCVTLVLDWYLSINQLSFFVTWHNLLVLFCSLPVWETSAILDQCFFLYVHSNRIQLMHSGLYCGQLQYIVKWLFIGLYWSGFHWSCYFDISLGIIFS